MGVDVRLLPLIGKDFWAAHDILNLERRRDLWGPLSRLPMRPIKQPFTCYFSRIPDGERKGESCYGVCEEDPYGQPLRYVTAADFLTLSDHSGVTDNWQNRAVWAYLKEIPPDWPIIIYWH